MIDYYKKYFLDVSPQVIKGLKLLKQEEIPGGTAMTFNSYELPIPSDVGDIIRLTEDYRIVAFINNSERKEEQSFLVKKINEQDNPNDYTKRVVEE